MTVKKSKEKEKIPFPKNGKFWEYFFWFMSNQTPVFVTILIIITLLLAFLSTDIGRYRDIDGKWYWTFQKRSMEMRVLKTLSAPSMKEEKAK